MVTGGWIDRIRDLEKGEEEEKEKLLQGPPSVNRHGPASAVPDEEEQNKDPGSLRREARKKEKDKKKRSAEESAIKVMAEGRRKLTRKERKLVKKARKRARRESGETRRKRMTIAKRGLGFIQRIQTDHIQAYATEAAFFLMMSFIPFLLLLTTLLRYTSVSYNTIRSVIISMVPQNLQEFVLEIVVDVYRRNSAVAPISLSAVLILWAAGKGVQAITNGLNVIYQVKETRNFLINRIYSIFYIVLFAIAIIVSMFLLVLGTQVKELIFRFNPFLGQTMGWFLDAKTLFVFPVLFLVFLLLFKYLPNRKASLKSQIPGALLTAAAWTVFSFFYALYYALFPIRINTMYGNLTSLIMMMVWLYFCMNMMLMGAEANIYFEKEFRKAKDTAKARLMEKVGRENPEDKKESVPQELNIFEEEDDEVS